MNKKKIIIIGLSIALMMASLGVSFKVRSVILDQTNQINSLSSNIKIKQQEIIEQQEKINKKSEEVNNLNKKNQKLQNTKDELVLKVENQKKRTSYLEKRTDELEREVKENTETKKTNGKVIAVDIGHNTSVDSGSVSEWVKEDDLTREVGIELIEMLTKEGFKVINVTPKSENVKSVKDSLEQRINKANNEKVDLFVSVHFNIATNKTAEGTEVFYFNEEEVSQKVGKNIINNFNEYEFKNRGLKKANFYVLKNAKVPALLVECAFIMNLNDMIKYDPYKMAQNIFEGIKEGLEV